MQEFLQAIKNNDSNSVFSVIDNDKSAVNHVFAELEKTPFALALEYGFTNLAQTLLQVEGFDIDNPAHNPLRICIELGMVELAEELLNQGANPNIRQAGSDSLLVLALENSFFDLAQNMLCCGAEVDIRDDLGRTPLSWAVYKNYEDVADFLLKNKANVHAIDNDGLNVAAAAWLSQSDDIYDKVVKRGAGLTCRGVEQLILLAYNNGQIGHLKVLLQSEIYKKNNNINLHKVFLQAIANADTEVVKLCLEAGANPNAKNQGEPAIYTVAKYGQLELLELLLDYDVNVNATSSDNFTPLYIAALNNYVAVADCLIKHGANINALCGATATTALIIAAQKYNFKIINLLLANEVNSSYCDQTGNSAWSIAATRYKENSNDALNSKLCELLKP